MVGLREVVANGGNEKSPLTLIFRSRTLEHQSFISRASSKYFLFVVGEVQGALDRNGESRVVER